MNTQVTGRTLMILPNGKRFDVFGGDGMPVPQGTVLIHCWVLPDGKGGFQYLRRVGDTWLPVEYDRHLTEKQWETVRSIEEVIGGRLLGIPPRVVGEVV